VKFFACRLQLLMAIFLCCCAATFAQSAGSISGSVSDDTGAALPGSNITVTNQRTHEVRHLSTDGNGSFTFTLLPIGVYTVQAEHDGFQSLQVKNSTLEGEQHITLPLVLHMSNVTTSVSVEASATEVERTQPTLGQTVHAEQVANLPLNGRDFAQLALLTPGTTRGEQTTDFLNSGTSSEVSFRGSVSLSVQGMAENTNDWRLDGVDDNELTAGGVSFLPEIDAIQEFNVLTNNYSAQYGSRGGSTILVSTKSGSNDFHGSAFEFVRNDIFDARNYFDPTTKGKYRQNEFGGSLGGPILKDKTFFFADYQGNRVRQGAPILSVVPTTDQVKNHIFTNPIFDPTNSLSASNASSRSSYYNAALGAYKIPDAEISSIGQAILNLLPSPMPAGTSGLKGSYNYIASPVRTLDDDEFDVRADQSLGENDHLFGRFSWDNGQQFNPSGLPGFGSKTSYSSTTYFRSRVRNFAVSDTHIFSAHIVNQFSAGYNRDYNTIHGVGYGSEEANSLGISGANLGDLATSGMTLISMTGYNPIGDRLYSPYQGGTNVFHYADSLSIIKGKHSLVFGFDYRPMQNNGLGETYLHGQMAFTKNFSAYSTSTTFASTITDNGITGANGHPIASLLLGYPDAGNRQNQVSSTVIGRRWKEYRGYAQDNWTISPVLTVNLGVAYMVVTPLTEANGRIANFDTDNGLFYVTGKYANTYSGAVAADKYAGIHADYSNVQPRIGFVWSPRGEQHNTVLSAGYGIFSDTSHLGQSTGIHQNPPYTNTYTFTTNDIAPSRVLIAGSSNNGFPDNSQPEDPSTYTGSIVAMKRNLKQGLVQQYNVNLQQGVKGAVVTIAYAGTHGTRLFNNIASFNGAAPGAGNNTAARRPFTTLNTIADINSNGWLIYNSLQAKVERRMSGFYLLGSYTYSQGLTNGYTEAVTTLAGSTYFPLTLGSNFYHGNSILVSTPGNSAGRTITADADRGESALQLRNNFTASVLYSLPFGRGHRILGNSNKVLQQVVGGWQANSIIASHSGFPMAFTQATNTSGSGVTNRPDLVSGCSLYKGAKTVNNWFSTSCFAAPTAQQLGNSSRTLGHGPQRTNVDFSIYKKFATYRTQNVELRAEAFNLLNHSQFGMPDMALGDSTFGAISTTVMSNRQLQMAVKYLF
jgi:hypothetical protein